MTSRESEVSNGKSASIRGGGGCEEIAGSGSDIGIASSGSGSGSGNESIVGVNIVDGDRTVGDAVVVEAGSSSEQTAIPSESNSTPFNFSNIWQQITNIAEQSKSSNESLATQKIVILGETFDSVSESEKDIVSKICLTYRYGFEPIQRAVNGPTPLSFMQSVLFSKSLIHNLQNIPSLIEKEQFTSDVGWGCMIRTSQSLLANTYLRLLTEVSNKDVEQGVDEEYLISLFKDTSDSPFSLHNFIKAAASSPLKVKPGEWFGPNAASLSIKRLCDQYYGDSTTTEEEKGRKLPKIKVLISESTDLYDDQIKEIFENDSKTRGLLVLFPVRLGIDKINAYYYSSLLHLLSLKQSVGISGGKPSSSFYFFGFQGDELIYMDPHSAQAFGDTIDYSTYHTSNYHKVNISKLDPSMMVGVLLQNYQEYEEFKMKCSETSNKIVHFHSLARSNSVHRNRRKNFEFVNIDKNDLKDEEEFISIDRVKRSENTEDFIDLGDDEDFVETNTNLDSAGSEVVSESDNLVDGENLTGSTNAIESQLARESKSADAIVAKVITLDNNSITEDEDILAEHSST
ncbi:uncharacterized protein RJT20DRAFT_128510 [Scheffersomyces xylosifermentans]|uniref:uncharacterized protein n=1 Tax=Scheffersomyces xylosifermentans TaxID=1304137 RepID=UPI00315D76F8